MRAIMPGILASLVNKALGSAADLSAIAAIPIATGAPCLPFLIAGLGLAAWDIFATRGQDGQLGNIDNDLQNALRKRPTARE